LEPLTSYGQVGTFDGVPTDVYGVPIGGGDVSGGGEEAVGVGFAACSSIPAGLVPTAVRFELPHSELPKAGTLETGAILVWGGPNGAHVEALDTELVAGAGGLLAAVESGCPKEGKLKKLASVIPRGAGCASMFALL